MHYTIDPEQLSQEKKQEIQEKKGIYLYKIDPTEITQSKITDKELKEFTKS